jgi:hypothetical protein
MGLAYSGLSAAQWTESYQSKPFADLSTGSANDFRAGRRYSDALFGFDAPGRHPPMLYPARRAFDFCEFFSGNYYRNNRRFRFSAAITRQLSDVAVHRPGSHGFVEI